MFTTRIFPTLLLAMLTCGAVTAAAQDGKALRFETSERRSGLPGGWAAGIGKGTSGIQPAARITIDSVIKQEGRYALSLSYEGDDFVSAVHTIRKTANAETIKLSGYLKTEDVKGSAGLWMRIDGRDRTLAFDNMQSRRVTGTTGWEHYEITLPYNKEEAEQINVGALFAGSGKIWIDNFRITLDGKDIAEAPDYARALLPAERDTSNYGGSGIDSIALTPERVRRLADLGALWGFLKYYHAGVQEGNHNMDAALFRFLPMLLSAKDDAQATDFLERWVDMFGTPPPCAECKRADQAAEAALQPDYGVLFVKGHFPPSLIAKLEHIRRHRSRGDAQHYYVSMAPRVGNPIFNNEYGYNERSYPDAGVRLLALYRYWNSIQYFFPYRHLIGEDWSKVLPDMIPDFCNAADAMAYELACLKLIARIHDTHGSLRGHTDALEAYKGQLILPFCASFIEGKLVVTGYYKDTLSIRQQVVPGDVIDSIDGVAVGELVKRYLPLIPASNYEGGMRGLASVNGFLLRSNVEAAQLYISHNGNGERTDMARIPIEGQMRSRENRLFMPDQGYKLLSEKVGYIYPALLRETSLDSIKSLFSKTKGVIIDLRCYPTTFMPFTYGAWLKPKPSPFARFTSGSTDIPGLFVKTPSISNGEAGKDYYPGKVVIIVNEHTVSQAEYTTMALQTVPGAITIGSTTAGADGNVSEIVLPGGLRTMISGIGVLYPDGTETQRKGIKIDRVVKPTIKGIREGRDELLEEAIRTIR